MKRVIGKGVLAMALAWLSLNAAALEVGDVAPEFSLVGSDGATHTLSAMRGQYVVVAFFPKAYTKG